MRQIILAGILGACFGSFLEVIAHRSVQDRAWWGRERSACEACGHTLRFWELVPIFSWIILRGKCSSCGERISVRHLLVEISCAFLAVIIYLKWGISFGGLIVAIGTCSLVVNSLTDLESGDVFDALAITPGVLCLIIRIAGKFPAVLDGLEGAAAGFGVFAAIIILSRGGVGWGDAVFMGGIGAVLGLRFTLLAFYIGIMLGGAWAVMLLLLGYAKWGRRRTMPLVPFLSVGCLAMMIYGLEIFSWLEKEFLHPQIFIASWPFLLK